MKPKIRKYCSKCKKKRRYNQKDECIYCNNPKAIVVKVKKKVIVIPEMKKKIIVKEKITQRCIDKKYKSNDICNGELKPKIDLFKRDDKNKWRQIQKDFKKQFGKNKDFRPLHEPKGYNCIECGACYDKNFKREEYNIGWLRK